jgi:hypothetical protein
MFSLKFMSKGKKMCGLDATVGGLRRIVQPFRVSINAKGGDCWHVFTGRVCLSLMERTRTMMENKKIISSGGEENNMKRSTIKTESIVQKRDQDQILDHGSASRVFMTVGSL